MPEAPRNTEGNLAKPPRPILHELNFPQYPRGFYRDPPRANPTHGDHRTCTSVPCLGNPHL